MPVKISISWPAWSGKSAVIREIVKRLWFTTWDVGQIFRARAVERWLTIAEYDLLVEQNPQEDIDMDNDFKCLVEWCETDIITSWRVGFHFTPQIKSIWLDVDPTEWARRIYEDDRGNEERKYNSIEEVIEANENRMKRLKSRLHQLYWIDFSDKNNHHKIIDTTDMDFEEVVWEIIEYINQLK